MTPANSSERLIGDLVEVLKACGAGKPTLAPESEQKMCWCFGWASMPCIDQAQCIAAREVIARVERRE